MNYECHVTLDACFEGSAGAIGDDHGFHSSKIDGDEVMGDGARFYLTRSGPNFYDLKLFMKMLCTKLEQENIPWQRRKIEQIILDERP